MYRHIYISNYMGIPKFGNYSTKLFNFLILYILCYEKANCRLIGHPHISHCCYAHKVLTTGQSKNANEIL